MNSLKNEKTKFQLANVISISFAHFVNDVYSSFLSPVIPLLINKFGISLSMAGMLNLFQQIPALFQPFVGIISEKIPARYLLIFAPTITAISMSLLGVATNFSILIVIVIFAGIGSTLFHVSGSVMTKKISGDRLGKGMSFFMLGGELARSAGPMLILGAIEYWSFEETYKLIPIGITATALLFFRFNKIKITDEVSKISKNTSYFSTLKDNSFLFINISGIFFFISIMRGSLSAFLPVYIVRQGSSLWIGGAALAIFQLSGAIGTFFSGTLSDNYGRKKILLITSIVSPFLMLLFNFSNGIMSFILLVVMGLFMFSITPVLLALVNDVKSEHSTFINGVFMTINFIAGSLGILIAGSIGDIFTIEKSYLISPLIGIFALPFIIKLKTDFN